MHVTVQLVKWLQNICWKNIQHLLKVCPTFTRRMSNICWKYVQHLLEECPPFAKLRELFSPTRCHLRTSPMRMSSTAAAFKYAHVDA